MPAADPAPPQPPPQPPPGRRPFNSPLMRPFVVLALPGMYLFYKYSQYKRRKKENARRRLTEKELQNLNCKIEKLLNKLEESELELASCPEEECVICIHAKATMQTAPCGHKVVCRKCFVKTIQIAVSQRLLPLRCVICRAKILRLKSGPILPASVSGYSMNSRGSSSLVPPSDSMQSMSSGASSISSTSASSACSSDTNNCCSNTSLDKSSKNADGTCRLGHHRCIGGAYPRQPLNAAARRAQYHSKSVRFNEYCSNANSYYFSGSGGTRAGPGGGHPMVTKSRLPPIRELSNTSSPIHSMAGSIITTPPPAPPPSTRIRCAQKIVTQLEHHAPPKKSETTSTLLSLSMAYKKLKQLEDDEDVNASGGGTEDGSLNDAECTADTASVGPRGPRLLQDTIEVIEDDRLSLKNKKSKRGGGMKSRWWQSLRGGGGSANSKRTTSKSESKLDIELLTKKGRSRLHDKDDDDCDGSCNHYSDIKL